MHEDRELLAIVKLPKPISQMSDKEVDAFAAVACERIADADRRRQQRAEQRTDNDES